jgi:predicted RNase H-like HicB family nuclease
MSVAAIEPGAEFPDSRLGLDRGASGYLVIIERGDSGFGAYVPDLPGVIAAADSEEDVMTLITEAIQFHLEGLAAEGLEVPLATSRAGWAKA